MKKQLSDAQVDLLLKRLVGNAAASDETIEEVANSNELRWSIQRNIRNAEYNSVAPWPPPISKYWRWLAAAAVPVAAAIVVAVFVFNNGSNKPADTVADNTTPIQTPVGAPDRRDDRPALTIRRDTADPSDQAQDRRHEVRARMATGATRGSSATASRALAAKKTEEIKTDFIQLTYAQTPASGQIIRVKVPSAMMVDLGVVSNVAKPTSLVDAEVVVGDDGMTHAIRFIRGL